MAESELNRRTFLKALGTAVAAGVSPKAFGEQASSVGIEVDPNDPVAASRPVLWAIEHLTQALTTHDIPVVRGTGETTALRIVAAGAQSSLARKMLRAVRVEVPTSTEGLGIVAADQHPHRALLACGHDARGLVYALTDLADVARNAGDPMAALAAVETTIEKPANEVRSMMRIFTSDVEDKPWYNDRAMWPQYFDMLAAQRFNRFNLGFGIGYDFIRNVTDGYFLFTYPFLLDVPGYKVRVPQLPNDERDRNLEMLKYISEQCVARGLEFHVGLWMHGYEWIDSPHANYTIEGLDKSNHGRYCRDALRLLLEQVPNISGLTFRIHGESGVAEGSFDFWKTVFEGVATCGRTVGIDMHAKGMSQPMIDMALATKQPVTVSPKFWGEHLGMPYHQADIRRIEKPKAENGQGLMALSSGTRSFLRYGYGDLLREDRQWKVVHRIWPGTQRLLLWGDAEFAAGYSPAFGFCGSNGVEIMEPLSFKGRRGSGLPGSRCGYADRSLDPQWDWQKYEYSTRVWGRMLYNPETRAEELWRPLAKQFGGAASPLKAALANASRILPIVTTAHAPSAANNAYWPEMYFNQSMVNAEHYQPYSDMDAPRVFGNASPFDPELFLSANQCAAELLSEKRSGKYTPLDAAQWIENHAFTGRAFLAKADQSVVRKDAPGYRRVKVDIEIQTAMGEFFAAKFRAGVLFHLYEISREPAALNAAIDEYKKARAAFGAAADAANGVYRNDVTFGEQKFLRGHWLDRLPAIDKDIAQLSSMLASVSVPEPSGKVAAAIQSTRERSQDFTAHIAHRPPARFNPGEELRLEVSRLTAISEVRLHYRHVNQSEDYISAPMERQDLVFARTIPADYTRTEFPLEYYFEVHKSDGTAGVFPGFVPALTTRPYFVVRGS